MLRSLPSCTNYLTSVRKTLHFQHRPISKQFFRAMSSHYQLQFYVPKTDTERVLAAVHATGAGAYPGGLYGECAFFHSGTGTFRPSDKANPVIGKVGEVERVEEHKVEVLCVGRECMQAAVKALKSAHPYEQVAFFVFKAEDVE